ncbi:MAG: hypothetical protein WD096_09360 [Actinomycetota bacterium]
MARREAVTKQMATRYATAAKKDEGLMLDKLCALTGWTRRHPRRAPLAPATPTLARTPRPRIHDEEVLEPLRSDWATFGALARAADSRGETAAHRVGREA